MKTSGKDSKESNRFRGIRPETEEKYRRAIEMYASTELSGCEICRICEVTESGFRCYLTKYHRELVLARYAILCSKEEAGYICTKRRYESHAKRGLPVFIIAMS